MQKNFLLFIFILSQISIYAQSKIQLSADNIINITSLGDAGMLVDEQVLCGDPKNGTPGIPANRWQPGYTTWYYPVSVIIDLKNIYTVSDIYLYDVNGTGNIAFLGGTPFEWDTLVKYGQTSYNQWKGFSVNSTTRYLQLTISASNVTPSEIIIYGTLQQEITETINPVVHQRPLLKDFIGMNAFIDDPIDVMNIAGFVREYHNWNFTEVAANKFEFNRWNGFWDFDKYYTDLKSNSVVVCPCIQENVTYHCSTGRKKPLYSNEDSIIAASYSEHAQLMYQYAARYGAVAVDFSKLKLNSGQISKSGLNLIKYYENWNEQDRWWQGKNGWYSPFEYAAMSSADYDGHLGSLGDGFGIKTADPSAKLVMGGLAKTDLEYIKAMMFWADHFRQGSFPADVLNFHHYSNDNGGQGTSTVGICPEADGLKNRMKKLVDFRDAHLPDLEIWMTEFGYDTHSQSIQRAPAYGTYTSYQVQAMWLIRSYLELAASGADKAVMFMIRDVNILDATKYSTSGLTTGKGEWTKKDSWYYVSTLQKQLGNFRFDSEINSGNPNVNIYRFTENGTNIPAYVIWCPTANSTSVPAYSLQLDNLSKDVFVIDFVNTDIDGDTIQTETNTKTIMVSVSERPKIIKTIPLSLQNFQIYNLEYGWNLISFNKEIADMSVSNIFSSIMDDIDYIKDFNFFFSKNQDTYLNSLTNLATGNST